MMKSFLYISLMGCIAFASCKSTSEKETKNYIDVSGYLKGQLAFLDTVPYAFLKITLKDTVYSDSVFLTKKEVNEIISKFLVAELEKKEFEKEFEETTFLDGTIQSLTLTYRPKNIIKNIERVDVYVNPETEQISKIYIVHKKDMLTQQLLWKHNSSFTLITTSMDQQNNQVNKTEKVIWNE